jgi:hypothetical protein
LNKDNHFFKELLTSGQSFDFEEVALALFRFQAETNPVYKKYLLYLGVKPEAVFYQEKITVLTKVIFKNQELKKRGV